MGTHPIFESDFDCLTDRAMSASGGTQSDIFKRYSRLHLGDTDTGPRRRAPGFKTRPYSLKLAKGDELRLTAELLGHPPPRVVWLKLARRLGVMTSLRLNQTGIIIH